jgi:hypothetical protein
MKMVIDKIDEGGIEKNLFWRGLLAQFWLRTWNQK